MEFKLYYGATIFFLNLLLDTNAIHFKTRANFREIVPCAMTGWSTFVRNMIWARPCKTRRTLVYKDLYEFGSRERGPEHNENYNPTYGFEPYWQFGDWVFDTIRPRKNHTKMCGGMCPYAYQTYGTICGVNKDFKYQTFDSFCAMKSADCDELQEYRAVYRGKCIPILTTYPTDSAYVVKQVDDYIKSYMARSPTTTAINMAGMYKWLAGGQQGN